MRATRLLYAIISMIALLLSATIGTLYIAHISDGLEGMSHWAAWGVFCAAIFFNLYYLRYLTFLRGTGDIAGENRAKTASRLTQLVVTAVLLACGQGLLGASVGYLLNGVLLRVFAKIRLHKKKEIFGPLSEDDSRVTQSDLREILSTISFIAWRDGVVQLALYASGQATTILCSLFLTLTETGTYSVLFQLGSAVYSFSGAYARSFYPMFQSVSAQNNTQAQKEIIGKSISAYWLLGALGTVGVITVVFPLIHVIKPETVLSLPLFLVLTLYLMLLNQHSIFCNYIISMNEIPYLPGYVIAAFLGVVFSVVLIETLNLGLWGLVLGQAISQLVYNNWKWPQYVLRKINASYCDVVISGIKWWGNRLSSFCENK